jgi:hypothetical protein
MSLTRDKRAKVSEEPRQMLAVGIGDSTHTNFGKETQSE